jgi:hypothetical protein
MGYAFEKGKGMPGRYIRTTAKADYIYLLCGAGLARRCLYTNFYVVGELRSAHRVSYSKDKRRRKERKL